MNVDKIIIEQISFLLVSSLSAIKIAGCTVKVEGPHFALH